jgi:hypothetical protein
MLRVDRGSERQSRTLEGNAGGNPGLSRNGVAGLPPSPITSAVETEAFALKVNGRIRV